MESLLCEQRDIAFSGAASETTEALHRVERGKPDVVVMNLWMPEIVGIQASRRMTGSSPETKVICIFQECRDEPLHAAARAGVSGYLLKACDSNELLHAIRSLYRTGSYVSPSMSGKFLVSLKTQNRKNGRLSDPSLSEREREVLQLLVRGAARNAIAAKLRVSVKTVSSHRENIMEKLGVSSVAELTKYAIREGWIPLFD